MTVTLYGLKNCDSCKKAQKHIEKNGTTVHFVDVRDKPPTAKQLKAWCVIFGRDNLVNKRSTTWRGLSDADKAFSTDAAAVKLLRDSPTLMKRPVLSVQAQGKIAGELLGFKPADIDKLLK